MKKILTESNIKKLQEELEYRMTVRRAEIAKEKLIAAAHGDRSENAEYKAACEEYRENDNRIQHLLTLITTSTIIDDERMDKSIIGINTKAKIKFLDGITNDLTIIPVPSGVSKTKMTQTKGAILVDDYSGNLIDWEASGGIGIKFTKEKESNCKFKNITSLEEILDIFD